MLDIVTYHYVRPIIGSEYPKIKGLEVSGFKRQLEYFAKERSVVSTSDVIKAVKGDLALPKNAVWLTFDDGYKDHFDYVLPLLESFGFDGAFFPVSDCCTKSQVLDVNKIHYILALAETDDLLLENLRDEMLGEGYERSDWDHFWASVDRSNRYDNENIMFFKRMLQVELPLKQRQNIILNLFERIVGRSEADVANELYMSQSDLISLHKKGFTVGSHTTSHPWLTNLSADEQKNEIDNSLSALKSIRGDLDNWIMCYPYGEYNEDTLSILKEKNCALALTSKVGSADLSVQNKYELLRLDTNDFPR